MKDLYQKYKHGIPMVGYLMIYLIWFFIIENREVETIHTIYMKLDDKIPFIELFVIPYLAWFGYVFIFVLYFMFTNKEDYSKLFTTLVTGMTVFLIISTIWPNGHQLRPEVFPRDNVFTRMIGGLYKADTSTNIVPSIHVYNSIAIHFAVMNSKVLKKYLVIQVISLLLCVSIVLSTVFIKQHSVFDLYTAVALAAVMYVVVYKKNFLRVKYD